MTLSITDGSSSISVELDRHNMRSLREVITRFYERQSSALLARIERENPELVEKMRR